MRIISMAGLLGRPLDVAEARNAPRTMYVDGPMLIPLPRHRISVIGTRNPTPAGIAEAREISGMLARAGATVVSGLAAGIDTVSHRAAIDAGGRTIAVLGTPPNRAYPSHNANLQEEIRQNHLIASQFPVGSAVSRGNFVVRNHTMALMSDAAVIVEAGDHSGTMHHARETLRLGRPLFVGKTSAAANPEWLDGVLGSGAALLKDHADVLESLSPG